MSSYALLKDTIERKHRAALLQQGKDLDVLTTRTPKSNWVLHPAWIDRLMWAGLLPLARLVEGTLDEWVDHPEMDEHGEPLQLRKRPTKRFSYDRSLLTCLVDRWRLETHTFHFPWGEMAPTLQDVSYFLGLPLAGAAIGPLDADSGWLGTMQARFLAVKPNARGLDNDAHGPRFKWLGQFEIRMLGYPGVQLTDAQVDRSLEAYLLWLFGKTMFTENHVNTVDARLISIAREIADARCPGDITQRSWGSAVLAATYRGLCKGCLLSSQRSGLVGCPLLLQLWSYERFPIGRSFVGVENPFGPEDIAGAYVPFIGDLPTVGSVWTRRERQFAGHQVKSCYPSFRAQFDALHENLVMWEPYSHEAITFRYPGGISNLCTRDQHYWMTNARLVFDVTVEEMALHRVMRQFGRCQEDDIPVIPHIPDHVHKLSRVGGNKPMDFWLKNIGPYLEEWTTAPTNSWDEVGPFDWHKFELYLQRYRHSTRIYMVPSAAPDQIEAPLTSDMYPTSSIMGTRHHARDLMVEAQDEVSALMGRVESGETIPQPEHVSWLKRFDEKLRGIYAAMTCRRSSDVAAPRPAFRPPRPSRHMASPAPRPSQPRRSAQQEPSPSQPGSSSWHEPSSSQPGSSAWQEPSPSWPGGLAWHQQMGPVSNQPPPSTHVVHSPMHSGVDPLLDSCGDDDDHAANTYDFSQPLHHTPPPPPSQETQTVTDEVIYGRGHRPTHPPRPRLSLSGPRPRKVQTRRRSTEQ